MMTYCERWNPVKNAPLSPLSPDEARARHAQRKPYTVVVEEAGRTVLVEMCFFKIFCHVAFLDDLKRESTVYSFVEHGDGRLFLQQVTLRRYEGDAARPTLTEVHMFTPDGGLTVDIMTPRLGGTHIERREHSGIDVTANDEPVPTFGDYRSLVRFERGA
jgi:hypothetical protein